MTQEGIVKKLTHKLKFNVIMPFRWNFGLKQKFELEVLEVITEHSIDNEIPEKITFTYTAQDEKSEISIKILH